VEAGDKREITKNAASVFMARLLDLVGAFFATVLVARYLGVTSFGDYAFVIAYVGAIVPITYFGLERIAIRELTRNKEKATEFLGAILITRWVLSAFAVAIVALGLFFMRVSNAAIIAIAFATTSEIAWSSGSIFIAVFRAFEKMQYETYLTLLYRTFYLASLTIVVVFDLGFIAIFIAIAMANILRSLVGMYLANTRFMRPRFHLDYALLKFFLKESYVVGISLILSMLSIRLSPILLKFYKDSFSVSIFQAPASIIMQMQVVPFSILIALFPTFSKQGALPGKYSNDLYPKAFKSLLLLGIAASAVLFAFSKDIILLIYGSAFFDASIVLKILSLAIPAIFLTSLNEFFLIAINGQRDMAIS
jgi:O-antigen/teichoic acid export membrane protein